MQKLPYFLVSIAFMLLASTTKATTLSDNLSNPVAGTETITDQTFVTASFGTDASRYALSSIALLMDRAIPGVAQLDLYSNFSMQPASLLATSNATTSIGDGLSEVDFNGGGYVLNPNATYWLVLKANSGEFEWGYTDSNSGTGVGFQHTWGASDDAGATWFVANSSPMLFRVSADPLASVPEPSSPALLLISGAGMALLARFNLRARRAGQ